MRTGDRCPGRVKSRRLPEGVGFIGIIGWVTSGRGVALMAARERSDEF